MQIIGKYLTLFIGTVLLSPSVTVFSIEHETMVRDIIRSKIPMAQKLARSPVLINAVQLQNAKRLTLESIKKKDQRWIKSGPDDAFKKAMQETAAGNVIKLYLKAKSDIFNEIFLTDNQGANVTAVPATSDYWQGDEDKFIKAFNNGNGTPYVGKIEYDKSTNTYAAQISVPVINTGKTIGVLVLGVRLSHVRRVSSSIK